MAYNTIGSNQHTNQYRNCYHVKWSTSRIILVTYNQIYPSNLTTIYTVVFVWATRFQRVSCHPNPSASFHAIVVRILESRTNSLKSPCQQPLHMRILTTNTSQLLQHDINQLCRRSRRLSAHPWVQKEPIRTSTSRTSHYLLCWSPRWLLTDEARSSKRSHPNAFFPVLYTLFSNYTWKIEYIHTKRENKKGKREKKRETPENYILLPYFYNWKLGKLFTTSHHLPAPHIFERANSFTLQIIAFNSTLANIFDRVHTVPIEYFAHPTFSHVQLAHSIDLAINHHKSFDLPIKPIQQSQKRRRSTQIFKN